MSKFKNSFDEFKKDPKKWRQDSWDRTSDKQTKAINIFSKLVYGFGTALGFLLGFGVDKKYFIFGGICLFLFIVMDPAKFKAKYGSKK